MPSRNVIRTDIDNCYYHVYSRGINKSNVFLDYDDKDYFLYLLARHLSKRVASSKGGYVYPNYRGGIEILTYCLMNNHLHLLVYQVKSGTLTALMKSVMTAYGAYFNRKYGRTGPLFNGRFKSARINNDIYLLHVSRYIHLNPRNWKRYIHSSFLHIQRNTEPEWLQTDRLLEMYSTREAYLQFVRNYEGQKKILDNLKQSLANS